MVKGVALKIIGPGEGGGEKTQVFRNEALPLIDEERFAEMYSADMGRPNRAVQTALGVLVLKEMFDLTDIEALEELEFNLARAVPRGSSQGRSSRSG